MPTMPFANAVVAGRSLLVIEGGGPSMWTFPLPGAESAAGKGSR